MDLVVIFRFEKGPLVIIDSALSAGLQYQFYIAMAPQNGHDTP